LQSIAFKSSFLVFSYAVISSMTLFSSSSFAGFTNSWKGDAPPDAIGVGMWTYHLRNSSDFYTYNNYGAAVLYNSIFGVAFRNCFDEPAIAAGVQRTFYTKPLRRNFDLSMGYRLGLLSGYDNRFAKIADYTPILPIAQIVADFTYKKAGLELTYTGIIVSARLIFRLP